MASVDPKMVAIGVKMVSIGAKMAAVDPMTFPVVTFGVKMASVGAKMAPIDPVTSDPHVTPSRAPTPTRVSAPHNDPPKPRQFTPKHNVTSDPP